MGEEIWYLLIEIENGRGSAFIVSELQRYISIFRESVRFIEEGTVIEDLEYIISLSVNVKIMVQKEIVEVENYLIYKEELYYKKTAVSRLTETVSILERISTNQWLLSFDIYNELYFILSKITIQNIVKYYFRIEEVFYKLNNVTGSSDDGREVGQLWQITNSVIVKVSSSIDESNSVSNKQEQLNVYSQVNVELQEIESLLNDIQMQTTSIGGSNLKLTGLSNFTDIIETGESDYKIEEDLDSLYIRITKTITELSEVI